MYREDTMLFRGEVAQWLHRASEFQSEDLGFDPLAVQSEERFLYLSLALRVNSWADFFSPPPPPPPPPSCVRHPILCACERSHNPSVVKEQVSQPVIWKHEENRTRRKKTTHTKKQQQLLGSAVLWSLAFPRGKAARIIRAFHWDINS